MFAALVSGCGGSGDDVVPYDASYDCEQSIACLERSQGPAPAGTLEQCVFDSAELYDGASDEQRAKADALFTTCGGKAGCEYAGCVADHQPVDSGGGPSVNDGSASSSPTATMQCDNDLALSGSIPSSAGSFAYNAIETRFWVNPQGCLTEVDVELKSGDCSVEFDAQGLLDAQGRYLIDTAWVRAGGLCPGYPTGLNSIYVEGASGQPFGTIEVQRDQTDWRACAPGKLIVMVSVVLDGGSAVDVGFSNLEIDLESNFSRTHLDPSGECPTMFF